MNTWNRQTAVGGEGEGGWMKNDEGISQQTNA